MASDLSTIGTAAPQQFGQAQASLDVKLLRNTYRTEQPGQGSSNTGDTAEISSGARGFAAAQRVAREALDGLRANFGEAQKPFLDAGKLEFIEEFENHEDFSPNGTADLILSGVTGYIFEAFVAVRPELTEADLDHFLAEARRGVEQGSGEARRYLDDFKVFDGEIKTDTERTIELVYEEIDAFVEGQREKLRTL